MQSVRELGVIDEPKHLLSQLANFAIDRPDLSVSGSGTSHLVTLCCL